ncbi:carboxypeptidase regulatory-like domain-containing protein [Hymenobacter sp. ISL-91]|uniref:carboxypeptidase-like regulatory domain-containing protein n=1 Tax=Hymenobacter sp. ISL-91 TaxID=2819151 RepID=UPI001BE8C9C7|nr:carboxypeptidase-like regulatory domain-containing protein [Hymenobacter sp. ISL-91]MBT2557767.1 carboxypeptidase regulatory-like domain-containing protein [Hymenobacter sp. ISL-91]
MHLSLRPFILAATVAAGSLLASCRPDADPAPLSPGAISGIVTAQDETGRLESAAGITVSLKGIPTSLTATTDATGKFEFRNLPLGTYDATFTRGDLGTSLASAIVLDAQRPTAERTVQMGKPATTSITSFTLTGPTPLPNSIPYTLQVAYNPALYPNGFSYMMYISNKANVSNTDHIVASYASAASGTNRTQLWISIGGLKGRGFVSGSTVYVVAYGAPVFHTTYPGITDGSNGITSAIISNLNPVRSPVLSFIMP